MRDRNYRRKQQRKHESKRRKLYKSLGICKIDYDYETHKTIEDYTPDKTISDHFPSSGSSYDKKMTHRKARKYLKLTEYPVPYNIWVKRQHIFPQTTNYSSSPGKYKRKDRRNEKNKKSIDYYKNFWKIVQELVEN